MIPPSVACVIHAGWPKCGSSALQTLLSAKPELVAGDRRYEYVAIRSGGVLLRGRSLRRAAAKAATGYINSNLAPRSGEADTAAARNHLAKLRREGVVPVLSNEGWTADTSVVGSLVDAAPDSILAVAYVRPHVEFVNSAWWQWGAWDGAGFEDWLADWIERPRNVSGLDHWAAHPAVARLVVRPLPEDVVADFTSLLGVKGRRAETRSNLGPGASMLRVLQRHRDLRSAHVPNTDFAVERALGETGEKPWVLDRDDIERVLASRRDDVRALQELMDPRDAAVVAEDPRWWDASAYDDRVAEPAEPQPPDAEELDDLAAATLSAILELDSALRAERSRYTR